MKSLKNNSDNQTLFSLSLAALGIVYGDIGTSPLYAVRESLGGLPINLTDVLGILSLIFWALILIISLKYLSIIFHADNEGEGGILSLLALLRRSNGQKQKYLFIIAIFGAGLVFGDGMLTPAISVISAVEGLNVVIPALSDWILPITVIILLVLFCVQFHGTEKIGFIFGPIVFIWFVTIGIMGINGIMHNPMVLKAVNPYYAFEFLYVNGWKGYLLLGGVFLVVTGGEALYTDLGHFGKKPIRISWFCVALPGLLLNYFGQCAYLLKHPKAITNPFYLMAPTWFAIPLLIIATVATIIASQAVISATYSLARQAVLLGLYPAMRIIQTSEKKQGQIYIPQINFILALGTLLLVITFQSSTALTHAYGIAVNLEMLLVTFLVAFAAYKIWHWNIIALICLFSTFIFIDLLFLGANLHKIITGGWLPLGFALICAFIMYTWKKGMEFIRQEFYTKKEDIEKVLQQLQYQNMSRIPDLTAIFITDIYDKSAGSLLHFLKLNRVLPDHILIINYTIENVPYVKIADRFEVFCLGENVCKLVLHYGFMDFISVPQSLSIANEKKLLPFPIKVDAVIYFLEVPNIIASPKRQTLWFFWQEKVFSFLTRNYSMNLNIDFYQLPYNRTLTIGDYIVV